MAANELVLTAPDLRQPTASDLLSIALQNNAAIDVIERMAALQTAAWEREALVDFNEAMNRAQSAIGRVAPDLNNPQTHSKYASYAALDRVVRPVYTREGINLSFSTEDSPLPESVRVVCFVSLRSHTRKYQVDMPADGKGAKGGDVMTKTHATGSAMQYGMRYLLKLIFNIAVGSDDDGNGASGVPPEWIAQQVEEFDRCETKDGLQTAFTTAANVALTEAKDVKAYEALKKAKDARKKVMGW